MDDQPNVNNHPQHLLASLSYIKEKVPEPYKMALLLKAQERGISYTLKCVHTGTMTKLVEKEDGTFEEKKGKRKFLRTKYAGVERNFKVGDEMELPATVASFIWDKFNVNGVAGSIRHRSRQDAPFQRPCFEEVINWERTDLGGDIQLRESGVAAQEDLLIESREARRPVGRTSSDEVTASEVKEVADPGGAKPAGGQGI